MWARPRHKKKRNETIKEKTKLINETANEAKWKTRAQNNTTANRYMKSVKRLDNVHAELLYSLRVVFWKLVIK